MKNPRAFLLSRHFFCDMSIKVNALRRVSWGEMG